MNSNGQQCNRRRGGGRRERKGLITGCQLQLLSPVNPDAVTIKSTQAKHTSARQQAWQRQAKATQGKASCTNLCVGKARGDVARKKNIEAPVSDSKAQDDGKLLQKRLDSAWLIDLFTSCTDANSQVPKRHSGRG